MTRLDEFLEEFEGLEPDERLELLIEFGDSLPPLNNEQTTLFHAGECRVEECQTPVFLWINPQPGRVELAAHVPEKSPTVRGFVAMLVEGLNGASPEEVADVPDQIVSRLGLDETLGMTRHRGFSGIVARIKSEVARHTG